MTIKGLSLNLLAVQNDKVQLYMYQSFYGLNDSPFSIAPNPHYLFLSDRHREALAHLKYGLGETGGFVLLTGEVGTGKTTVSRSLLKQLPENTDTAFILNPALTELELLATLCDELGIEYEENPSLKQLTDKISAFLLNNHKKGRDTLLIIDEAQHLKAEVLEQLRLLTNLETDTKKLLQVILIGQPELQILLKRRELRQLAQRITARYHLLPLSEQEIALYVQHRLHVAGREEPLFTRKAIKYLHRQSGGIPRLTNLLCERALMAGYAQSKTPIDHKMIMLASAEVLGEELEQKRSIWPYLGAVGLFGLIFAATYAFFSYDSDPAKVITAKEEVKAQESQPQTKTQALVKAEPEKQQQKSFDENSEILTQAINHSRDIKTSFAVLFGLWGKVPYQNLTPCQGAQLQGLDCHQQQGGWQVLTAINYPALLYFRDLDDKPFYGAVIARDGQRLKLQFAEQQIWITRSWFEQHYAGTFELLWHKPQVTQSEINQNASSEDVQWLENQLAKVNHRAPRMVDYFDVNLKKELMQFQQRHGLKADGIVGRQTFVQLNLYASSEGPRLTNAAGM